MTAVRDGRLTEERLAEAAARVTTVGEWTVDRRDTKIDRAVGAAVAARALRLEGDTHPAGPVLVVECVPERMMAADPMRRGLGDIVVERDPRSSALKLEDTADVLSIVRTAAVPFSCSATLTACVGAGVAERLIALRPDTVVVDVGYPGWRPAAAAGYVTTFGAGRVNLEAAAEVLLGGSL